MMEHTRRQFIGETAAAVALGSIAGCVGAAGQDAPSVGSAGTTAAASFFVFGDFAAQVAGESATAETLVPVGQHGHGWEPGPAVREAVLQADLIVYGMEGFQPWADDIVRDLRADGADVRAVAAGDGIELLEPHADHEEDGHEETHHEETDHQETHHEEDGHEEADHEEHGHDLGADPHFWLDPLRASQAVDTIREGFAAVDPSASATYGENAAAYRERLEELHGRIESALSDRGRDVLLVAGHDAFQYLHDRYGFEIEALSGLAPDDLPSTRDVARAQEVIEEHGLEYVCADPLESQRAAEQLVAETDAESILPLTAMPGRTAAWTDQGWGYLEVMERVNLPTLERALDAR